MERAVRRGSNDRIRRSDDSQFWRNVLGISPLGICVEVRLSACAYHWVWWMGSSMHEEAASAAAG